MFANFIFKIYGVLWDYDIINSLNCILIIDVSWKFRNFKQSLLPYSLSDFHQIMTCSLFCLHFIALLIKVYWILAWTFPLFLASSHVFQAIIYMVGNYRSGCTLPMYAAQFKGTSSDVSNLAGMSGVAIPFAASLECSVSRGWGLRTVCWRISCLV